MSGGPYVQLRLIDPNLAGSDRLTSRDGPLRSRLLCFPRSVTTAVAAEADVGASLGVIIPVRGGNYRGADFGKPAYACSPPSSRKRRKINHEITDILK